jgi:hypothetical protein
VIHFPIHEGYTQKEREIIINKENKSDTIRKEYVIELEREARSILNNLSKISDLDILLDSLSRYSGLLSNYSSYNALLIEKANPNYTIVRSKDEWDKFGYMLKKDAKGIPILYPIGGGKKIMPGELAKFIEEKRAEGLSDEMIMSLIREDPRFQNKYITTHNFNVGFVYDKRDVIPNPKKRQLQEWDTSLTNEQLYQEAKNFAEKYFKVVEGDSPDARGYSAGGEIHVLKVPGESKTAVDTILHEIAHEMLGHHNTKLSREAEEMEAELVAYLVAKHYGVDLKDHATRYMSSWYKAGGYKTFGERNLDRVMKTAHEMIKGINETKLSTNSLDKIKTEKKLNGVEFEVSAFHPLKFEEGVYAVNFHKKGTLRTDKNSYFTQVRAKNSKDAIEKVADEILKKKKGWLEEHRSHSREVAE